MMNKEILKDSRAILVGLLISLSLNGCSKSTETPPSKDLKAVEPIAIGFGNLGRLKDKSPGELLKDKDIGNAIHSIVPEKYRPCMTTLFSQYMQGLNLTSDGSLISTMTGAHVDNWMEGFVSISPNGPINIALQCNLLNGDTKNSEYLYFTNQAPKSPAPAALVEWVNEVGSFDVLNKTVLGPSALTLGSQIVRVSGTSKVVQSLEAFTASNTPNFELPKITDSALNREWRCYIHKPDGGDLHQSVIRFQTDGHYTIDSPDGVRSGTYAYTGRWEIGVTSYDTAGTPPAKTKVPLRERMIIYFRENDPEQLSLYSIADDHPNYITLYTCGPNYSSSNSNQNPISPMCAEYFARLDQSSAPLSVRQMQATAAGCGEYNPN